MHADLCRIEKNNCEKNDTKRDKCQHPPWNIASNPSCQKSSNADGPQSNCDIRQNLRNQWLDYVHDAAFFGGPESADPVSKKSKFAARNQRPTRRYLCAPLCWIQPAAHPP